MGIDGKVGGMFAIADPVKETTPAALKALREAGIRVVMLTDDNKPTALAVGQWLGIAKVEAESLPENKGEIVKRLRSE
jgi:Cu+-exporting ATPase